MKFQEQPVFKKKPSQFLEPPETVMVSVWKIGSSCQTGSYALGLDDFDFGNLNFGGFMDSGFGLSLDLADFRGSVEAL